MPGQMRSIFGHEKRITAEFGPKARIKKLDEESSAAASVHLHQSGKWWKSRVDRVRYS